MYIFGFEIYFSHVSYEIYQNKEKIIINYVVHTDSFSVKEKYNLSKTKKRQILKVEFPQFLKS